IKQTGIEGVFMRKIITFASIILLCTILIGCSKEDNEEETTPADRFDTYVDKWNEQAFTDMYDFLSKDASKTYSAEDFTDRYENIYEEIDVKDLHISYDSPSEEEQDEAIKNGEAEIDFSVEMETVAGPIDFDYKAMLVKEEDEEENEKWFINWDPGFIFPELEDGGNITVDSITPERGNIYDRNDNPLAINDTIHDIGVVPERMDEETSKNKIADLLDIDEDIIDAKLDQDWVEPDLFVPIKKIQGASENLLGALGEVKGVSIDETEGRVYPLDEAASHLVGYIGQIQEDELEELEEDEPGVYSSSDMIGKRGLEQLYEKELRGKKGIQIIVTYDDTSEDENNEEQETEEKENVILEETPVEDGKDITVTIDADVQQDVYEGFDGDAGTAAALDPKSGETLALVSSPTFSPNERLYGMSTEKWEKLSEDKDTPLVNRFATTFAPGSSLKPITAAIGLENGTIDPEERLAIKGKEWSNGESWGNYSVKRVHTSNEQVNLKDALVESDNIYFAMQAVEMGGEKFVDGLK